MSGCIIIIGRVNKKHILPFLLALIQIILSIINEYYPLRNKNNIIFACYNIAFGKMFIRLFPLILKISEQEDRKNAPNKKSKYLYYFLVCLFDTLNMMVKGIGENIIYILDNEVEKFATNNPFLNHDFIVLSCEMIFLVCISIWLLKYIYHKHHVISMIVFIIFGIICDIVIDNFGSINKNFFLIEFIRILECVMESFYFCYQKYLMEKLYFSYWNVSFVQGVYNFFLFSLLFFIILINPDKENSSFDLISNFYSYFIDNDNEVGLIIGKEIIEFILYIFFFILFILVLCYFEPNFMFIIIQLSYITKNIMEKSANKLYSLVFYIIQFIALLIHLELLELNFCGLNKHIKRNIDLRGMSEFEINDIDSSADTNYIDFDKDYKIKLEENNEEYIEMGNVTKKDDNNYDNK